MIKRALLVEKYKNYFSFSKIYKNEADKERKNISTKKIVFLMKSKSYSNLFFGFNAINDKKNFEFLKSRQNSLRRMINLLYFAILIILLNFVQSQLEVCKK